MNTQIRPSFYSHFHKTPEVHKAESTDDEGSQEEVPRTLKTNICKFKTEMCKNFSENGYCPYGEKCQFAHGAHELVAVCGQGKRRCEKKKCRSFWQKSMCGYGTRCQFSHCEKKEKSLGSVALRFLGERLDN